MFQRKDNRRARAEAMIRATPSDQKPAVKQICYETGLSYSYVCSIAREMGRPIGGHQRGITSKVADLADGTLSSNDIAAVLNEKRETVRALLSRLRKRGVPVKLARGHSRRSVIAVSLQEPVRSWYLAQIPEGGNEVDLLRGFITDAYHEEVGHD